VEKPVGLMTSKFLPTSVVAKWLDRSRCYLMGR